MISTSAIWTQDEASGIYNYKDTTYKQLQSKLKNTQSKNLGEIQIDYEGSKTGIGDKFIKNGALLFARQNKNNRFTYIGMVEKKVLSRENSGKQPALFHLTISLKEINGVKPGYHINNEVGLGPKKSALKSLGYEIQYGQGGGNIQCGLNSIKQIVTP
jgi:hypothetical protein